MKTLFALLLMCVPAAAVEISPPSPVPRDTLVHIKPAPGERVFVLPWIGPVSGVIPQIEVVSTTANDLVFVGPPGTYAILTLTETSQSQQWVQIASSGPTPPVPPDPTPDPTPPTPDPTPQPGPIPFPAAGLTVVTTYETQETAKLPPAQASIFTSSRVHKYLNDHCMRIGADPAWRAWDDDLTTEQLAFAPTQLAVAYKAAKQQAGGVLPWIVISDGKQGFSGPLPKSVDEMMLLLQKYGGP